MKKFVLVIGLFFLLVSCQSMSVPASTATPVPTNTIIPPTATNTTVPTPTPIPPTLTPVPTLVNIDFEMPEKFTPFENQFPLGTITQTNGYILRCAFNSAQVKIEKVRVGNLEISYWVKCYFRTPDGRTDYVNFPFQVANYENQTWFIAFGMETTDPSAPNPKTCSSQNSCGFAVSAPGFPNGIIPKFIKAYSGTDKPKTYIMGLGFGTKLSDSDLSQNFFQPVINKLETNNLDKFASTGDTSYLPNFGKIEHFLPAYDYLFDMFK
jgi:hypothetical protein